MSVCNACGLRTSHLPMISLAVPADAERCTIRKLRAVHMHLLECVIEKSKALGTIMSSRQTTGQVDATDVCI